ncbi:conserved hypothetical protein [Vibrio chagasii]|nr:conserved hypothetical protein [Vibrio chagasii]CAH7325568.1 conserved hypothetical protein [Vibrio chagasii]CAH7363423.1 conserved hypothetical protein [Vibrio chagasii]CAH7411731.1 conserved hypothetical protein [Vibrio chagasii]CAH7476126.1 conserved hypothetical protein [Vibrio chagasii]
MLHMIKNRLDHYKNVIKYRTLKKVLIPKPALNKKVIFIHVPKAAGTSICTSIYGIQLGHIMAKDYYLSDPKHYNNIKSFGIVREPIARFISAYYFLENGGMNINDKSNYKKYIEKYKDINDFVSNISEDFISNCPVVHFKKQVDFLYYENRCIVDFVYKLEDINNIDFINDLNLDIKVGSKNVNSESNLNDKLNDDSIEKIKHLYREDFDSFYYK